MSVCKYEYVVGRLPGAADLQRKDLRPDAGPQERISSAAARVRHCGRIELGRRGVCARAVCVPRVLRGGGAGAAAQGAAQPRRPQHGVQQRLLPQPLHPADRTLSGRNGLQRTHGTYIHSHTHTYTYSLMNISMIVSYHCI